MTTVQKVTPAIALAVVALAILAALIPFKLADGQVQCDPPLLGADPDTTEQVGFVVPERDCLSHGRSKLLRSGFIALFAVAGGTAIVALNPASVRPDWLPEDW